MSHENSNQRAYDLKEALAKAANDHPQKIALKFIELQKNNTSSITFDGLYNGARAVATKLCELGLVNKNVLLLFPTGLDFTVAFLGCLYAGSVAVPVKCPNEFTFETFNPFVETAIMDAAITTVITTKAMEKFYQTQARPLDGAYSLNVLTVEDILEKQSINPDLPPVDANALRYLQYTSGSTSLPKGVMITQNNINHNLACCSKHWGYTDQSITLTWSPHTHIYGLICGLLLPLYNGSTGVILAPEMIITQPMAWLQTIAKERVTHSGCPNFGYELCINRFDESQLADGLDLSCWQCAINGGEAVLLKTMNRFHRTYEPYGFQWESFYPAYGMSEFSGLIASKTPDLKTHSLTLDREALTQNKVHIDDKPQNKSIVSLGKPVANTKLIVVDPNRNQQVAENEIGELWLSSPCVAQGYWQRPEPTAETFRAFLKDSKSSPPYLRTGDLGFIKDDELYIVGRLKEIVIIHGKNYQPLDIELTATSAHDHLQPGQAAAFTIEDKDEQSLLILLHELKKNYHPEDGDAIVATIKKAVAKKMGITIHAVGLIPYGSLPKTASGKIQRLPCKNKYLNNHFDFVFHQVNHNH